jgi:hypothetical protein
LTAIRQTRRVQRVVLVSDVSEKFKARFDGAGEKQETTQAQSFLRNSWSRRMGPRLISFAG